MKKLLLTTTALALSAGVAAADVTLSGDARMGLIYNGDDVQLTSRARVTFTLTGETDGGLAFGASFRADNAGAAAGNTRMTAGNVFISGDFGRLSMGDVAGAARAAVGDLHMTSLTGLGDLNEVTYLDRITQGADRLTAFDRRTAALYSYSIDGLSLFASVSQNNVLRGPGTAATGLGPVGVAAGETYREWQAAVGASYTLDGFTGAIGYEYGRASLTGFDAVTAKHIVGSAQYSMDGITVKGFAGRASGDLGDLLVALDGRRTQYGLSATGTFDAVTVSAFGYRNFFTTDYGIGASYDLGGGASFRGGIARSGSNAGAGIEANTVADIGVAFTF